MTRMTKPDCAVMCNLINTHTHTRKHTLQRVPTSGGRDRSSTYSAAILFCFTAGTFIPHASPSLQVGGGACEHPTTPFARPGVCTSASYRGVNRVRGTGRSERSWGWDWSRGWERGDERPWDGDGEGAGTGTGVKVNEGAKDGNEDGSRDEAGTGTGAGVETRRRTPDGNGDGNGDGSEDSSGDGNGNEENGNGNEDRFGEGERVVKKRKKPQNSCRRHAGKGADLGGKREKCRKERVGPVAAKPDNLESNKESGGGHKVLRTQVRIVQVERVCLLCRV